MLILTWLRSVCKTQGERDREADRDRKTEKPSERDFIYSPGSVNTSPAVLSAALETKLQHELQSAKPHQRTAPPLLHSLVQLAGKC